MLLNKKFGRLTTIEKIIKFSRSNRKITCYKCICDCGNKLVVQHVNLQSGHTKSCGCLRRETASENGYFNNFKHGNGMGCGRTKEYKAWQSMKQRCYNFNRECYDHYGGRGIKVCDEWLNNFEAFLADVGPAPSSEHSIDRINNDGNYEPGNVKWSTVFEQNHNRS